MLPRVSLLFRLSLACLLLAAGLASAATVHVSGPAGASVRLGDRDLGLLPLAGPLELPAGIHVFQCRLRGHEDLDEVVVIAEPDQRLHVRLRPLPLERGKAVKGSLLYAGLGQWYMGADLRGWLYFLGETGGLLTALAGELQRSNYEDDYVNFQAYYDASITQTEIDYWKQRTDQAYRDMEDMASLRDTGLYVALGSYALSLLDAWLLFPSVDVGPGMVPPDGTAALAPLDTGSPAGALHAAVVIDF